MKIELEQNYVDKQYRLAEIENELKMLDEKLKTPARTLDDLILHIQLLKERNALTK